MNSQQPKNRQVGNFRDLGFGTNAVEQNQRLVNKDGTYNVEKTGLNILEKFHLYDFMIQCPWWVFHFIVFSGYLITNIVFAMAYYFIGMEHLAGVLGNSNSDKFFDAFFFSAQTLTTVGYGRISPIGFTASAVASFESMIGLLGFALITGLLYGKFSRPQSKIIFSNNILVSPFKEGKALMFRIANQRNSMIIETEAQLVLAFNANKHGKIEREYARLKLEREKINMFPLSWTIVHPIDNESPLHNLSLEELKNMNVEITILLKGFDDSYHQQIYSRYSYLHDEIIWGAKFIPCFKTNTKGIIELDFSKLNSFSRIEI
jgi:inward rectifier potassium channel